jgi:hypothetical protein
MKKWFKEVKMEELLPKRISFSLRELEELGFLKVPTAKKLIKQKKLKSFKVGSKNYVTRDEVLDYVERNSCI